MMLESINRAETSENIVCACYLSNCPKLLGLILTYNPLYNIENIIRLDLLVRAKKVKEHLTVISQLLFIEVLLHTGYFG